MRQIIICLAFLLIGGQGYANDLNAKLTHTIVAADTAATAVILDTAFSSEMDIRGARYLHFFSEIAANGTGTLPGYADDTFFVDLQTSARGGTKGTWDVHEVDTFLTVGVSWSVLLLDADATVFGNKVRARVIYKAINAAYTPDSLGNVRTAKLKLWVMPKGGF
ncbi:MAG: hypothetical protein KAV87_06925 [Desulfobacteraceae bacterium]|nr:hypothetical protein [Desulfobacteraceae bacterium]